MGNTMSKHYVICEDSIDHNELIRAMCACKAWEYEPIKPRSKSRHGANGQVQHFCGRCNSMLYGKPKYCSECGQPVKWN